MNEEDKLNHIDIFKSVRSSAINGLTPEILETGFNLLIESDVLKEIPVLGIGFKGYSLYKKVTEFFFTEKLLKFLFELKDIPQNKREEFIVKLEKNNEDNKAGEKLLITLNRLNDVGKASIIGKLFKKTILEKISFNDFKRLTHIVDITYFEDLKLLENNEKLLNISTDIKASLYQVGLLTQSIQDNREHEEYIFEKTGRKELIPNSLEYRINSYGKILSENGFN